MARRLIIVPRWSGNARSDFYPWLGEQLAADPARAPQARWSIEALDLPEPGHPRHDTWPPAIAEALGRDPAVLADTVVLAHSVGCQASLHALATLPEGTQISALLCVAGWWQVDEPWPTIVPWQTRLPDLARVRDRVARIIVLLSDDDPFTRDHAANAALWRERLGAEVILVAGARHFNTPEAPAVLATLRSLQSS
jgi:predicted alpha/beta hydrolase family esterase